MHKPGFRKRAGIAFLIAAIVIVSGVVFSSRLNPHVYPRQLQVGDRWTYKVLFPDSKSYTLREIVQSRTEINGTEVYVIYSDDDQHISTSYMWLTPDWHELETYRPQIGNLQASSTAIYDPPAELFHLPFHVGDRWFVNSTITTSTVLRGETIADTSILQETRQTMSFERVHSMVGDYGTFKVTVLVSNLPYETLWFAVDLDQVVYAEFYNSIGEKVTQILLDYALITTGQSSLSLGSLWGENAWQVICTTNSAVSFELKISYEH